MDKITLKYGSYDKNGNVINVQTKDFHPIKLSVSNNVEVTDYKDLTGRLIRNVLYEIDKLTIVIGTDELYDDYLDFLQNFWSAVWTAVTIGNVTRVCVIDGKGEFPLKGQNLRREFELKMYLYEEIS